MFSSTKGAGLFAPELCMSVVVPAAFEASADRYIAINVAYRPLKFEFLLKQVSSSVWLHFNYHVPDDPFGSEGEIVLDVPFLQI